MNKSNAYVYYENLVLRDVKNAAQAILEEHPTIDSEYDLEFEVYEKLFGDAYTFDKYAMWVAQYAFFQDDLFNLVVKHCGTGWQEEFFTKKNAEERADFFHTVLVQSMYIEKYNERKEIIRSTLGKVDK